MAHKVKTTIEPRIATVQTDGQWWIVKRFLNPLGGTIEDSILEGPFPSEGPASQRATALALAKGIEDREARLTADRERKTPRKPNPAGQIKMNAMIKFLTRETE